MHGNHYFLNDDHTTRECTVEEWANQLDDLSRKDKKHLACDDINGFRVSTVWLGLNHNYFVGEPLIFETMVFPDNSFSEQYALDIRLGMMP